MESKDARDTIKSNHHSLSQILCIYAFRNEQLYRELQTHLILWQKEGHITWLEISAGDDVEQTLSLFVQQADLILLLTSSSFFANDTCYMTMKAALQENTKRQVPIIPIIGQASSWKESACGGFKALPDNELPIAEWEHKDRAYENIRAGLARFIVGLSVESSGLSERSRLFQARDLPKGYVPRPKAFDEIKRKLLEQRSGQTTAITTALRGAGGFGKTTLALALCHDPEIQATFPDGILWVDLGERPPRALDLLNRTLISLGEFSTGAITLDEAQERWRMALQDKVYLIVIDDVWQADALASLLDGGQHCVRLVTTRNDQVLPKNAARIWVDAMDHEEAIATLCEGLPDEIRQPAYQSMLEALVVRLNCWPLLLTLARGMLLSQVHYGRAIVDALQVIENAYESRVVAFDLSNEHERQRAAGACLETSLRHIEEFIAARYYPIERYQELAIFDEDTDIPLSMIQRFWKETGKLESWETEDLCINLHMLSLLLTCDLGKGTIRLHDVMRSYLVHRAGGQFSLLHGRFLDAQRQALGLTRWSDIPLDNRYLWHFLIWHLCRAARWNELHSTLIDIRFLANKAVLSGVASLETNLLLASEQALAQRISTPEIKTWQALHRRIVQISHLLRQVSTPSEMGGLLLSHLGWEPAFADSRLVETSVFDPPLLIAWSPLPQIASPALLRTLSGHTNSINSCAISSDRKIIVSASADRALKVWNVSNGKERLSLKGHTASVDSCTVSPDGRWIVSASSDKTLKVWDIQTGRCALTFPVDGPLSGCTFYPDGVHLIAYGMQGMYFLRLVR